MNQPWIYMCSPSRSPLPPPSPSQPSRSSQCTSPEHLSHLGWWSVSPLIVYLFQCCSLRTSHPRLLPQSPNVSSVFIGWMANNLTLLFFFFFNLSIVDLQCCINLCCIAKWFIYMHSHTYTYMHSFLYSLLLWLKQGIEYSFLCRMVGSSCLLILYIMVCIY